MKNLKKFEKFLNPILTLISEIDSNGDRTTDEENSVAYMDSPPTDACTFFGKHAYTGEEGFGQEYKYDLTFQGTILNFVFLWILLVDFQVMGCIQVDL